MAIPMYGQNKDGEKLSKSSEKPLDIGTDLADGTAAITLVLGTTYREVVTTGGTKPLTLPAISESDLGKQILIISNAVLAASGIITIACASGDTYHLASSTTGLGVTAPGPAADANNLLTITGANTNCGFQKGSTLLLEVVASDEWMCTINSVHIGSGSNTFVYTTA